MTSVVRVDRVEDLRDNVVASYECYEYAVEVKIRDDVVDAEGARVITELLTAVLQSQAPGQYVAYEWHPPELTLVRGGGRSTPRRARNLRTCPATPGV